MKKRSIKLSGVQPINQTNNKPILRAGNTGYAALISLGLTTVTPFIKNKSAKKMHKPLAFITTCLTLLHVGTVIHNKLKWKKKQKEFIG